jgi:signal transduction histidine kinase
MRAMRGYAELLLGAHASALDANGRSHLEKITAGARRLDSLIDDVLTYTRVIRSELTLEPVDVEALLREVVENYPAAQAHASAITIAGPMPPVVAHEASLTQCFSHLLANALKFTAPATRPQVRIYAEDEGAAVRIWIEDNGIGIAPHDQERIFNLFERITGPDQYGGTGLGLAVVRKAVERLKGRVGVESTPGRGSRFWVQLSKAPVA